ncbi:hypothetical protein GOBAR_DD32330 [Gossypium barbadense]|nr:hypothetical protein GOBAR_DD32330 [Gossypium barbadense]
MSHLLVLDVSEFYGPTRPEASQAQAFTFLVRDQRLGANVGSAQGPTGLGDNKSLLLKHAPFVLLAIIHRTYSSLSYLK